MARTSTALAAPCTLGDPNPGPGGACRGHISSARGPWAWQHGWWRSLGRAHSLGQETALPVLGEDPDKCGLNLLEKKGRDNYPLLIFPTRNIRQRGHPRVREKEGPGSQLSQRPAARLGTGGPLDPDPGHREVSWPHWRCSRAFEW